MKDFLERNQQKRQVAQATDQPDPENLMTFADVLTNAVADYNFVNGKGWTYRITRIYEGAPGRFDMEYEILDSEGKVVDRSTGFAGTRARDRAILKLQFPSPDSDDEDHHP